MSKAHYAQRHDGRVSALQYLYAWSINPPDNRVDDLRIFFEEVSALVKGDRMRVRTPDLRKLHAWRRDQIMHDSNQRLTLNRQVVLQEVVVILMNRPM